MNYLSPLFIAALLFASTASAAPEAGLFSISLDSSAAAIPECGRNTEPAKSYLVYEDSLCVIKNSWTNKAWGTRTAEINLPSTRPQYLRQLTIETLGDRVLSVTASTYGEPYQARVASELESKFGKPTSKSAVATQNAFGAKYRQLAYTWRGHQWSVEFEGFTNTLDWGLISLSSAEFTAIRQRYERQSKGAELKP